MNISYHKNEIVSVPPITRSKSGKEPNALREAARSHRPITNTQKKKQQPRSGVRKRS